jgi:hypothetical protein
MTTRNYWFLFCVVFLMFFVRSNSENIR